MFVDATYHFAVALLWPGLLYASILAVPHPVPIGKVVLFGLGVGAVLSCVAIASGLWTTATGEVGFRLASGDRGGILAATMASALFAAVLNRMSGRVPNTDMVRNLFVVLAVVLAGGAGLARGEEMSCDDTRVASEHLQHGDGNPPCVVDVAPEAPRPDAEPALRFQSGTPVAGAHTTRL